MTEAPSDSIIIKRWSDTPPEYQALSTHGGDEDWVVFIPPGIQQSPFHNYDDYFPGWGGAEWHTLPTGVQVVIYAHA